MPHIRRVKNAPLYLVQLYEEEKINLGRELLGRLLTDERMRTAWKELARHTKLDGQWLRIWGQIAHAKRQANKIRLRKSRSEIRNEYLSLAKQFATLAKIIAESPLDVLAYNLLDQDSLDALGISNLHNIPEPQRGKAAHQLLHCWPSAPELLMGMNRQAKELAGQAMRRPRADQRASGNVEARVFISELGAGFRTMFRHPLAGTIATITNVTFRVKANKEFDKTFVQQVLRGSS